MGTPLRKKGKQHVQAQKRTSQINHFYNIKNMGIGKSRGTSPINVNDMLENVEMNQQIESEKQEIDKLLIEIRETKETLIKFNEDLEKAIAAECHIEGALKAIAGSCENIVNGICNAIVKAERDTKFKTTLTPEQLVKLRQLIDHSVESWISVLANHRSEQTRLITEHEANMRKILRRNGRRLVLGLLDESLGDIPARYTMGLDWLCIVSHKTNRDSLPPLLQSVYGGYSVYQQVTSKLNCI